MREWFSAEVGKWEGVTGKKGQALRLARFSRSSAVRHLRSIRFVRFGRARDMIFSTDPGNEGSVHLSDPSHSRAGEIGGSFRNFLGTRFELGLHPVAFAVG